MSVPAYGQCATQDRYCCSLLTDECFVVSEERFFHVRHHQGRLQRANLLTGKYLVDKEAVVKTILCMHLTTCMLAQSFFAFIQVSVTFTDHSSHVVAVNGEACVRRFVVKKWRASRSARTPPWWTDVRVAPQGVNCQHFSIEMSALGRGRAARATPTRLGSRGRYAPIGRKHAAGIGSGSGQTSVRLPRYHHKQPALGVLAYLVAAVGAAVWSDVNHYHCHHDHFYYYYYWCCQPPKLAVSERLHHAIHTI